MNYDHELRTFIFDRIAAKRLRIRREEGWTIDHDDSQRHGELADAAACYAATTSVFRADGSALWPWDAEDWSPQDRLDNLVQAAALIVAEIERVFRAQEQSHD